MILQDEMEVIPKLWMNDEWIEYILNLSNQGYFTECWEEIIKAGIKLHDNLYSIIALNLELESLKDMLKVDKKSKEEEKTKNEFIELEKKYGK